MGTIHNQVRLTGMMSGLDTDALVKAMLSGQQSKIDKLNQQKIKSEWKKDALTEFNNQLKTFRETFGSVLGSKSMMSKGSFIAYSVSMESTTALSVKGTAGAKAGEYSVRIDQVAAAASMTSAKLTTIQGGYSSSVVSNTAIKNLSSLSSGSFAGDNGQFSFDINGTSFSFSTTDSLQKVMDTVNKSGAGVTMSYSQITDAITIVSNTTGAISGIADPGDPPAAPAAFTGVMPNVSDYSGNENDASYLAAMESYQAQLDDYNTNVKKPYDDALSAYNKVLNDYKGDQKRTLNVTDTSGFLAHLGMTNVVDGQDALVSINGGEVMNYSSNKVTLDGIEFEFKQVTAQAVSFSLTQDTQSSVDKIKSFVEEFNKIVKTLYDAYYDKKNYKYTPLTDEMKAEMSDAEIEQWDIMAKGGLLARDNKIGSLLNSMRGFITETLGGAGTLKAIGISSSGYKVGEAWTLEIDEAKLTQALQEDADKVFDIFGGMAKNGGDGLVTKLNAVMDSFVAQTKTNDIANLTTSMDNYTKRIKEMEDKMYIMSERYYLQYAQLETALAQMQSQSNYVSSMFGLPQSSQ